MSKSFCAQPGKFEWATRFVPIRRAAIQSFLAFHLLTISCWCLPLTTPLAVLCRSAVRPYFLWAGLFQSWDMFSPNPKDTNSYIEAIILYEDGSTRTWAFPRMERLSLEQRRYRERYRKYVENLKEDRNAALWPDAARCVARLNDTGPYQVEMVLLVRYWSHLVPRPDGSFGAAPWYQQVFYAYRISPGELTF